MTFRCFLPAWITAWVIAIFLPSIVIAFLGLAPATAVGVDVHRLPATAWKVADDVGPAVKLMIGESLLAGLLGLGQLNRLKRGGREATSMVIGAVSVAATMALVPESLSRGFGIGLTGTRFDPATTPIYLLGGALGGLFFAISAGRCAGKGR